MIFENVSYRDLEISRQINQQVGRAGGFWSNIRNGGSGFGGMFVEIAPLVADAIYYRVEDRIFSVLELRPKGVIIRSKVLTETYALVVPYTEIITIDIILIQNGQSRILLTFVSDSMSLLLSKQKALSLHKTLHRIPSLQHKVQLLEN